MEAKTCEVQLMVSDDYRMRHELKRAFNDSCAAATADLRTTPVHGEVGIGGLGCSGRRICAISIRQSVFAVMPKQIDQPLPCAGPEIPIA